MSLMIRRRRRLLALAIVSLAAIATALAIPRPAWAHASLTATVPADGAQLAAAPSEVKLSFNEPVSHAHLAVEGPDGLRWDDGTPTVVDTDVTQRLHPLGPAGSYAINYRVVSVDGHAVQGTTTFILTRAGSATPPPQPATTATDGAGGQPWLVPVAVVVVLALGIAVTVAVRPRREAGPR